MFSHDVSGVFVPNSSVAGWGGGGDGESDVATPLHICRWSRDT